MPALQVLERCDHPHGEQSATGSPAAIAALPDVEGLHHILVAFEISPAVLAPRLKDASKCQDPFLP